MGLPAAKHLDPVLGVDTHIVLIPTPAGPVPTPIPHPYVGMLLDVSDYLPFVGTCVKVNGMQRAVAGTAGQATPPHIPMGGAFAKPPSNESEMFMGSMSVNADGEPMSFTGLPVLSCQDIGMPAPLRKKKSAAKSLMLPTSTVIAIPAGAPVLIGGAPTIAMPGPTDAIAPLGKGMAKALKALAKKSKKFGRKVKRLSSQLHKFADAALNKLKVPKKSLVRNKVHRSICAVTGHPVDIATGKVFTDFEDLTFTGPFPLTLERVWYSTSEYRGPLGHGWHHSFDMALAADAHVAAVRLNDGRVALFDTLSVGEELYDANTRYTLRREPYAYTLRTAEGLTYRFVEVRGVEAWPLASIQDRNGFAYSLAYDARGRLERLTDSGGLVWTFRHDADDRVRAIEGPHPDIADARIVHRTYAYDDLGNLVQAADALGGTQTFSYAQHLLTRETNKNGLSFQFTWDGTDSAAKCLRTWGDGGIYDHKLTYGPRHTIVENSLGFRTTHMHDGAMVHKVVDALGHTTLTEYDAGYRVLAEVDALGQRTSYTYDERGNLVASLAPDGASLRVEVDARDLPVKVVDALGGEHTFVRDERGRVLERRDPLGHVTRYHYHAQWLVGVTAADGAHTGIGYDTRGRIDAVADPNRAVTRFSYDEMGRLTSVTDALGAVERRELDALGRTLAVHTPDGNVRRMTHDREGNVLTSEDVQQRVRFTYVGMNRLASRSEAGTEVRFAYDTEEQLRAIHNEHGRVYRFELGPTGEVDEEHGFDGLMRRYERDAAGRVLRVDRPGERFSEFKHDPAGRVVRVTHSDGVVERFAYRLDGAMTHASNAAQSLVFARDPLGRVLKETAGTHWVESTLDALGRRVGVKSSLGADVAITRDALGDVRAVASGAFGAKFTRDVLGRELGRELPGGLRTETRRDTSGRPTQHTVAVRDQALRDVTYHWEPSDRLRAIVDSARGTTTYGHDALGNLVSARYPDGTGELRIADAVGNLFRREDKGDRQYGPAGQLLAQSTHAGPITYDYDPEGNLVEKREPGERVWRYTWAPTGMLASVTRPDGDVVEFAYDPLGRRIEKAFRGQKARWVWDGNVPLHEWVEGAPESVRGDEALTAQLSARPETRGTKADPITWLFEPESFAPLAKVVGGRAQSTVTDHLGTPVLMVDDAGERVWSGTLGVYGVLREGVGERHACPFRWPGQVEDLETGLYYNRFRYYDAEAGQYVAQDPIGLAGGLRLSAYVRDTSTAFDPFGLEPIFVDPTTIAFSQRTVSDSVDSYARDMKEGKWEWDRSGPLRTMEQAGQLVSYDNRRLLAAQQAGVKVPITVVNADDIMPSSNKTWGTAFDARMNDPRNRVAGGPVPRGGLQEQPRVVRKKGNHCGRR